LIEESKNLFNAENAEIAEESVGKTHLTVADVLRRYSDESLPAFADRPLTDVNQIGLFGERPLHVACTRGNMEEIEALVQGGADVNAEGELGNTPLHEAVGQGHREAVKFLLEHGASRTAKNEFGETPLSMATAQARIDIISLLKDGSARSS
jgi:ankyrin repeat protein